MIRFGVRQLFDSADQVEERFSGLNVPVEAALPYYWNIYEPVRRRLLEIAEKIKSYDVDVLSIHAVQAPLTDERFREWGKETADFARALGAKTVTLHPNNVNSVNAAQKKACNNLEYLTGLYNGEIVFCIETFEGKRRVFTPDQIIRYNLPMTLDISHVQEDEMVWDLLKQYKQNIVNVHLSARDGNRQHLPIDNLCKEVVSYLIENNWNGNVILEYLFEHHNQLLDDLKSLRRMRKTL